LIVNALSVNDSHDITTQHSWYLFESLVNYLHIPEEVARSCSLDTTATGEVLFLKVQETFASMAFLRRKLTIVTADGDRNTDRSTT
jgi:hypothetical protein